MKLVELKSICPSIQVDLVYATKLNFTGEAVYSSPRCFLQKPCAERLERVQQKLLRENLCLKVLDAYRPLAIQKIFWKICPDPRYVADPAVGSKHNRGCAVDLTLVDQNGSELPMPSPFDDFSEKAHRSWMGGDKEQLRHRQILEDAMVSEGFLPHPFEWWHFDDPDWESYPILDLAIEDL